MIMIAKLSKIFRVTANLAGAVALLLIPTSENASVVVTSSTQPRTIVRRPWPLEPVRVVAAKTKNRGSVEIGPPFDEDDDWLDGLTLTVLNKSEKIVTAVGVEIVFPREPGDSRNKFVQDIYFGPSPTTPAYAQRDPNKVIKPGETGDLEIKPQIYNSVKAALQRLGYLESIKRIELRMREVGFEDGTVLLSGTLYTQDPNSPNDPTKKIRADRQPR